MAHNMLHVSTSSVFELNWFPPTISAVSLHSRSIRGLVIHRAAFFFGALWQWKPPVLLRLRPV